MSYLKRYELFPLVKPESRCLTLAEACAVLHTSPSTLRRMIKRGEIAAFRIPNTPNAPIHLSEKSIADYICRCEEAEEPSDSQAIS